MRRSRKRPSSSTDDQPPSPVLPAKLKKRRATIFQPRAEDQGGPVSTSTGIVSSVASSSQNQLVNAPLYEPGPSKESGWKTAYGAARMAVEIAKESSDLFLPLKAVVGALSVLIKNYDQTTANADQIRDLEERIQSLSLGEALASPVGDQDSEENARREALRKRLTGIIAELRPLSEQHGLVKFLKNAEHANALNGFVQDLAYAVMDYQTSLQQSTYENTKRIDHNTKVIGDDTKKINETTRKIDENTRNIIEATDLELLGKLEPVRNAGYQAGHHDTCLRGTRESVLDQIMQWAKNPRERHVFWLNGLAGTGKSTIAQTFSGMAAQDGILGASFFCSRDYLNRKELKNIFPTLAYQLACRYPSSRSQVIRTIKQDPSVAQSSLLSQLKELIVDPLSSMDISCVIVVDALDECVDDQPASAILSVLARYVKQLPSVKFFITGRPEPRIRTGFRLPLLGPLTQIFLLHEVELSSVSDDIRLYLQEKLSAAAKRRSDLDLTDPWPSDEDLATLTEKSSGLFIFASTLTRFIESEYHEPDERLRLIVHPSDSTVHEGRAGIDLLYTQVLHCAFSEVKETTVFANLRRVLGAVVLAFNPLSRAQIAEILGIKASLISTALRHLHSVLLIPNEGSKDIRIFHKSFPDFLQDPGRCSDSNFFINPDVHHGDIALGCLELLKKLEPNPCDLPDFVMNRDVSNLPELLEKTVGSSMWYACLYWAMHVRSSPTTGSHATQLVTSATEFLRNNAVPWIEVMSMENRLESVIHSIHDLFDWIGMVRDPATSDLRSLAQHTLRFTMHFFHPVQQSAPHAYHSALPLSPSSSMFPRMDFLQKTLIRDFRGRSDGWGAVMRTIKSGTGHFTCITTFSHWIAAACDDGTVGIYNSVTGAQRVSLSPADPVQAVRGSPDGFMLFCMHQGPSTTVWDIQTGGLVYTFIFDCKVEDIAVSCGGRYLGSMLSDGSVRIREIASRSEGAAIGKGSAVTCICWLEPEEWLVVGRGKLVEMWDVVVGTALWRFGVPNPVCGMVYSQKHHKLAIVTTSGAESTVTIIDPRSGTSFTDTVQQQLSCFAFSQTERELICGTDTPGLRLFNFSMQGWRSFDHPATIASVSTISNGTVVVNVVGSGIQLLSLDGEHDPFRRPTQPALTVDAIDEGRIIAVRLITSDHIILLEPATMSTLFTLPGDIRKIPTDRPPVLCASRENQMVVCSLEREGTEHLGLWRFHSDLQWTVAVNQQPSFGGISPGGSRLATLHNTHHSTHIYLRDVRNGELQAHLPLDPLLPTNAIGFKFTSNDRFYSQYDTYRIPYFIALESGTHNHSIIELRHKELPPVKRSHQRYYDVDDTREWVISSSKRVCWVPPGFIGSGYHSYCWGGSTLVMVGQDGQLRGLTFRRPF